MRALVAEGGTLLMGTAGGGPVRPVQVFISYAYDSDEHVERVRDLWIFLRAQRIDAKLDRAAAQRRQDWRCGWVIRAGRLITF